MAEHFPMSMVFEGDLYKVRCHCGWKAQMDRHLLVGCEYYTERLKRIGFDQHAQEMKQVTVKPAMTYYPPTITAPSIRMTTTNG